MNSAQQLLDMFANRYDCFMLQQDDASYRKETKELTTDVLKQHLRHEITLSLPAISPSNTCKWIAWDLDHDFTDVYNKIHNFCKLLGLTALTESRRFDRLGHVWIFFDSPFPSADAYHFLNLSRIICGLDKKTEIYPPKSELTSDYGVGLRIPFGLHKKLLPEKFVGLFADCESGDINGQIRWLLAQKRNNPQIITDYNQRALVPYKPSKSEQKGQNTPGLDYIPKNYALRDAGNEWIGACPYCREIGQDKKGNNLSIKKGDNLVFCHYNHGEHSIKDIKQAFQRLKESNEYSVVQ
jgi:hypothetical protein